MNELRVDDRFSEALEAELVSRVQKASPSRTRKRTRMWLGAGVLAGAGILGGVGATAARLFVAPGSQKVMPLSTAVTETHEGTATVEPGDPPEGSTGIQMELNCLTPGLIAVIATNGTRGYVYRTELEDADGTAAMKTFKSPEEALAWQEARRGKTFSVPVYDSTGKQS